LIHQIKEYIMNMNRNDTIELILEHAIQQGMYSQIYMDRLSGMNDAELNLELERVEDLAMNYCDMPSFSA
jgi:hypothetical protein